MNTTKEQKIGKPAIYKIVNADNSKLYVGSCVGHYLRKGQHWYKLRKGTHDNNHLQSAWNMYGEDSFVFEVIEYVDNVNELIEREQYWIDSLKVCNRTKGYNKAPRAGSNLGLKMSEESKAKMSKAKKGVKQDPEVVKRRALSNSKKVDCYDVVGDLVMGFNCIRHAADFFKIDPASISKALSDKYPQNKTAGGYIWKFGTS
jgi:hypothetical protein